LARPPPAAACPSALRRAAWPGWVLPEERLPPLWGVPGQPPAQEGRGPSEGKRLLAVPLSAPSAWAPRAAMPGRSVILSIAFS